MRCPYCNKIAMFGAKNCASCGRPLSSAGGYRSSGNKYSGQSGYGKNSYGSGRNSYGSGYGKSSFGSGRNSYGSGGYGKNNYSSGRGGYGSSGGYNYGGNTSGGGNDILKVVIALVAVLAVLVGGVMIWAAGMRSRAEETSMRDSGRRKPVETTVAVRQEPAKPEKEIPPETTKPPRPSEEARTESSRPSSSARGGFTIASFRELKDYLAPDGCIDEEIDISFKYTGSESPLTYTDVCHILGAGRASVADQGNGNYRITAVPYPGAKILKAYRTGDTSGLNADELKAMEAAIAVVDSVRKQARSDLELELLLHDWMCENISYYNVDFDIDFTEKRPLTVIGALLDGRANCQGYTDCFYLLGNMAGFYVDKQAQPGHVFNTIKLGDQWYIVDVTHDDTEVEIYGNLRHYYQFFNVGRKECDGRTWDDRIERRPVAASSADYFYYNQPGLGTKTEYQKIFSSLDEMAKSVANAYGNGQRQFHLLLRGSEKSYEALSSALKNACRSRNITSGYYIFARNNNANTYFYVEFSK